jgi:hypothetical protein
MTNDSLTWHGILQDSTMAFCSALLSPPSPLDLLSRFFRPDNPRIVEHGPSWANARLPFLGKTFTGIEECISYSKILSEVLEMHLSSDAFPDIAGYIVDSKANSGGMVGVVGKGRFVRKKKGKVFKEEDREGL